MAVLLDYLSLTANSYQLSSEDQPFTRDLDKKKNGDMKSGSLGTSTPPPERKSKFASIGKLFKPWKWKRKKKSEKIEKTAVELERKISLRSTREELMKKGVLKPDDGSTKSQQNHNVAKEMIEETPEPPPTPSEETKESTEAVKESGEVEDKKEESSSDPPVQEGKEGEQVEVPEGLESTTITTQAQITPISTQTTNPVLTTANARPMIIPAAATKVPQEPPIPAPRPSIAMEMEVQQASTVKFAAEEQVISDNHLPNDDDDEEEDLSDLDVTEPEQSEQEPNLDPGFEQVPASEPDLNKQPKKSALKSRFELNGGVPVTPEPSAASQIDSSRSHCVPNHVRSVNQQPKPSPLATPLSGNIGRPRLRAGFVHVPTPTGGDSDKENTPIPVSMPVVPSPVSFQNTPKSSTQQHSYDDSSSDDEEIKYRDDDEDDEMETSSLAAKVARQDSLARFLSNRPSHHELIEKNIIPSESQDEKQVQRFNIGHKLTRRLSLRPTQDELMQRNILHNQSSDDAIREKEEKKKYLIRKLSFRPTIDELKEKKIIKFSDYVEWTDANEYDRRGDKPWTRLTPKDKAAIRKELNEFKSKEMAVHEDSRHLTRFHRP
ncbi:phosphatase and actin regulator 1-like isoform X2 [Mizuhopecten yessoensis]|uniref:phosphatase and actin regulator 1-like isoform X2 n=1 Tax=Mizuhopecten yessoensis TaxID=6573 RepID=UPI000B45BE49|nr:phosphatase and actin regulator 1-like isoform X2 [Mizuhopecten yessoensis]